MEHRERPKTFVAVVVLQLAEEGRIDLDAGIDRYLPGLPGADRITPRQLLQHTSGLGEYLDKPAVRNELTRRWTPSELIAVAESAGRVGEPGGPYHYSNTNCIVLGEIIEQVTGHSWSDEVRTRIAVPLGMTHTSVITDEHPVGYKLVDGTFVDFTFSADPSVGGAAGALQSDGRDLLRFTIALADGTLGVTRLAGRHADLRGWRRPVTFRHRPQLRARTREVHQRRDHRYRPPRNRRGAVGVRRLRPRPRHRRRGHDQHGHRRTKG